MSLLGLWISASLLGCCVGYVLNQPPADYYYPQWQTYDYQPQPLQYQSYDYQPSYYSSYYNYYPVSYNYHMPYNPYPKPELEHGLSYDEGQKLLQVYRLIRVIVVFQTPQHKKINSLDKLVEQLTKQSLQDQLAELVCHVHGYEEVAELEQGLPGTKVDLFVDDTARLLLAIQRALNDLDLGEDGYGHGYHYQHKGFCRMHEELCQELRHLRDQANALSVPHIKKERVYEIKAMVKQALDTDILEDLDEELENRLLDLDDMDIEMPVFAEHVELNHIDEDEPAVAEYEDVPVSNGYQYDEETLDRLAIAMDLYLQHKGIIEAQHFKEKSQEMVIETTTLAHSTDYPMITPNANTTMAPAPPKAKEDSKDSWFGSLFGKENHLPVPTTIDVSQPAVLIEPEDNKQKEQEAWIHEDVVEKDTLDFDIDERFQAPTNTKTAVTHSVPIKLMENAERAMDKDKGVDLLATKGEELLRELPQTKHTDAEAVDVDAAEDIETRELPFEEDELLVDEDSRQQHLNQQSKSEATSLNGSHNESEDVNGAKAEPLSEKNSELPVNEDKPHVDQQSTTAIVSVEVTSTETSHIETVTEGKDESENLHEETHEIKEEKSHVDEHAHQQSTTENVTVEETSTKSDQNVVEPVNENVTEHTDETTRKLSVEEEKPVEHHDHQNTSETTTVEAILSTTPTESHEEHPPPSTTAKPDARYFAKEEVFNVLSLLEETKGFTELKERISIPDVEQLVDGLRNVEAGVRWTEMLSALQKMVTEKELHSGKEIVDVLEHWKRSMRGQLDNGYFNRTYGGYEDVEVRELGDDQDDQFESRNYDTVFRPVDTDHPEMAHLVPHIIQQLRLGNISEEEQLTLADIFDDQWPMIVEEAFRYDQEQ